MLIAGEDFTLESGIGFWTCNWTGSRLLLVGTFHPPPGAARSSPVGAEMLGGFGPQSSRMQQTLAVGGLQHL